MVNAEFFDALEQLEREKGIPVDYMLDRVGQALITAYKRDNDGMTDNVFVEPDRDKKTIRMYVRKTVVKAEDLYEPYEEITLEEAAEYKNNPMVGDIIDIDIPTKSFGRIAAQTAKQVIIQGIREAERGMVISEFESKEHEILTGVIARIDPRTGNAYLDVVSNGEKSEAVLAAAEQVRGEQLTEGQRLKVYLIEVRRGTRGPQVVVSRTHPGLVKRLFELEVPEIHSGVVEVKSIAREAGNRTKIAVTSHDENVDPIGACVGTRGARVAGITGELERREDRHHQVERGHGAVRLRGARARGRHLCDHAGGQQVLPRDRAGRPALARHRQGGPERPPRRQADRLQDRYRAGIPGRVSQRGRRIWRRKKIPMRQCLGCREMFPKRELIRVVRSPEGGITLDFKGKAPGRGAYLCGKPECLKKARKSRAIERALSVTVPEEVYEAARAADGTGGCAWRMTPSSACSAWRGARASSPLATSWCAKPARTKRRGACSLQRTPA